MMFRAPVTMAYMKIELITRTQYPSTKRGRTMNPTATTVAMIIWFFFTPFPTDFRFWLTLTELSFVFRPHDPLGHKDENQDHDDGADRFLEPGSKNPGAHGFDNAENEPSDDGPVDIAEAA